jgi:cell volume regulation protein A
MPHFDAILLFVAALFIVSILVSKGSVRLGVPSLLLFLAIGMLLGEEGPGRIPFDNAALTQALGVVALIFILFSAGLDTDWRRVRPVLAKGVSLATLGVLFSALLVAGFLHWAFAFSWLEALLLGSIISSTDAAAVFTLLRSKSLSLRGELKELIEFESGSNDPMAVFLTLGVLRLLTEPAASVIGLIGSFFLQMGIGALFGYVMGRAMLAVVNRARLEYEGLYPVLTLALVLLTYGLTAVARGNGFLAVYCAALVMGNGQFLHRTSLRLFHDGIAWLMQIAMFIVLGLLVYPSRLLPVMAIGLLTAAFLMLAARPLSVFAALALGGASTRQKLMVSWAGLRGAVPIILATFPRLASVPNADLIFNIVFFIVLTSVLVQGTTVPWVARRLKLNVALAKPVQYPLEFVPGAPLNSELREIEVAEDSAAVGKQLVELRLPPSVLIVLVHRGEHFVVPRGSTVLEAGDRALLLVEKESLPAVQSVFGIAPASSG